MVVGEVLGTLLSIESGVSHRKHGNQDQDSRDRREGRGGVSLVRPTCEYVVGASTLTAISHR